MLPTNTRNGALIGAWVMLFRVGVRLKNQALSEELGAVQ